MFKRFFFVPTFSEGELALQRQVLKALLTSLAFIFLAALFIGLPLIFKEKVITSISLVLMLLICAVTWALLRRGAIRAASTLLTGTIWIVTTALILVSGGIYSHDIILYAAGTVIAGLLQGVTGSIVFGGSASLVLLIAALLQQNGLQPPSYFAFEPITTWFIIFTSLASLVLPLNIAIKSLANALGRTKIELQERRQAEQAAQERIAEIMFLYEFGNAANSGTNLAQIILRMREQIARFFPNDAFYVALYNKETDMISYPYFFVGHEVIQPGQRKLSASPGITGSVIRSGRTIYIRDVSAPDIEEHYQPLRLKILPTLSYLGVPLTYENQVIGVISTQSNQQDAYSPDQIRLFETLATQASAAIQKANLIDQLQRELVERKRIEAEIRQERDASTERRKLLEKVIEMGKQIAQVTDLSACMKMAHDYIQKELGFDRVGLFIFDELNNTVNGICATNQQGELEDNSWFSQNIDEFEEWQSALKEPSGIVITPNYTEKRQPPITSEMYGVTQHATLSAWAGEKPMALITVDNAITNRPFKSEAIEALRLLTGYIGLTVRNARLNAELEHRVQERTRQLELAMNELESFSYSVGHDLRSPLRAMHGFSQIILDENASSLNPAAQKNIKFILQAAEQMGQLIDALLQFSRLTRIPMKRVRINLSDMAQNILVSLLTKNPHRNIKIEIEPGLSAEADAYLMETALQNLLENAWKFTSATEQAVISFSHTEQENQTVFVVRDNGAGFDMSYSGKLFGPFQRLHRVDEFPGNGAGLAIVQRIIHRHGGQIWAQGETGKGAAFYFTLG